MNAFGYGTLLFDDLVEQILGRPITTEFARLRGFKRRRIVQEGRAARGPAITEDESADETGDVCGKILFIEEDDWPVLDAFENSAGGYEKEVKDVVRSTGETLTVGFYIAGPDVKEALSGVWSELEFMESGGHEFYVKERIPQFLLEFRAERPDHPRSRQLDDEAA